MIFDTKNIFIFFGGDFKVFQVTFEFWELLKLLRSEKLINYAEVPMVIISTYLGVGGGWWWWWILGRVVSNM